MTFSILAWFRQLYSLDTLDTRFTASANTPLKAAADSRPAKHARANSVANNAAPSKWGTLEFYVYYVVFLFAVPWMFKSVIEVSQESHPTYATYAGLLSPGWIFGRQVDNSDAQYSGFRDNVPYLLILLVAHPVLRRVYELYTRPFDTDSPKESSTAIRGDVRLRQRVTFDLYFAPVFLFALHGISALKVLGILYTNYKIAKTLPKRYIPAATWVFNIATLFANELCQGYPFERVAALFVSPAGPEGQEAALVLWGRYLDSFGGLLPRWEILFNITVLRLISFNMDYYWSFDYPSASPIEKKQLDPAALSERDRISIPAEPSAFNARHYLAYTLYAPLYLIGPILTFNDYISQQRHAPPSLTKSRIILYGTRVLLTMLSMEMILHFIYVQAISKASPNWSSYTPGQLSMLGFFNLHIIWLKLLIPWRFFRLWALVDGVDPPENMVRCVSNNYSGFAFWRAWHRSFNRWIIRYIYIPLGGGRRPSGGGDSAKPPSPLASTARQIFNFLVVFTFVALWHDINLRLLMWGWLITLFILPEAIATLLFPARRWRSRPTAYRVLCGVGAVGNILMMMIANLVGFALGIDGLKGLLAGMLGSYSGLAYLAAACGALFVGVQVMFEIREEELRAGVNMKC
ncbi:putative glycerol:H+ symporter [Aspergillus taichungensis]|uniref:Putative glycerol:H+ symporter n=1 Tax=Aspergillus taichungensis TaxID=482145 RepID=A0A2J5HWH2_9EURO|nr:putative glycerol:H+ symporter [Aspergillus taichungensis]